MKQLRFGHPQQRRFPYVWRYGIIGLVWLLGGAKLAWATAPEALAAVQYRLEVTYDAEARTIHGQATVTATWHGPQALTDLYFFLPPNTLSRRDPREPAAFSDQRYVLGFEAASLAVQRVTDGRQHELPFRLQDDPAMPVGRVPDQAVLVIPLSPPTQAGEPFTVGITFTTRLPQARNWGVYQHTLALDGQWYPMLVPYRRERWVWGMQEFVHAHYTLRLTTSAAQQVIASVPWSDHAQHNNQQTLTGSAGPLYHLGLSGSAAWYGEDDLASVPALRVRMPQRDAFAAAHLLQTLRSALAFYAQEFGLALPETGFTLVVHERDLGWPYSATADNVFFLSRDVVRVPALVRKYVEYAVARGVARQWWGIQTAYNLNTERWIGEGLVSYLALRWLDYQYGPGRNFLTWRGDWLPNFSYREQSIEVPYRNLAVSGDDQSMATPLDATPDRQGLRIIYEKKAALVYSMLHDLLGAQAFRDFLQRLLAAEGGLVTGDDVRRTAEAVSGQDLAWFFQQWVQQRVQLDYAVGRVQITPQTDASGQTIYVNRVEIRRVGQAVMPLAVRLLASDGGVYDTQIAGTAQSETVTWQHTAPLSEVFLDPDRRLPDVQRLNNTSHVAYSVRPIIDFPRLDRYLLYPFVTLDNNYIDGNIPRLHLIARYLDDQEFAVSVGYKEIPDEVSVEGQIVRNRFPQHDMVTSLAFSNRMSAYTLSLQTSLLLEESHQQQRLPANRFTLGYRVAFLQKLENFNGEQVPEDFAPSTGRLHSFVLRYERDTRIPPPIGAPLGVFAEPLAYGYALRVELELASELLGSTRPDMQQVRWEAGEYLRLWNQTMLQLRLFGGWSAGSVPLQRKLTLAGVDAVRGYTYRLRFLGDRMLGGSLGVRFPILRDVRLDEPTRFLSLRSLHLTPFVDGGWIWDRDEHLTEVSMRSSAGLRFIVGFAFVSTQRFEVAVDVAQPIDTLGRREDEGVQVWIRLQSSIGGGEY
jgi:hypothetical protein